MRIGKLFVAAGFVLFPAIAAADPCAGAAPFTDVLASSIYCTETEWLKNRNVTLGCVGTNYCPNDSVTRASMALFMKRLGVALSPETLTLDIASGPIDLDVFPPNVLCQTTDHAVTGYPRRAFVMGTFVGLAAGALDFVNSIAFSLDGGATWNFYHGQTNRGGVSSARWTNSSIQGVATFAVGETVRWGLSVGRSSGGAASTADFTDSRCFITVAIFNRNSAISPFDVTGGADGR